LQERSLADYESFCAALHDETGIDPQYERNGELDLLFSENALSIARSDLKAAAEKTLPSGEPAYVLLSTDEARRLEPLVSGEILGALECRKTAQVRNPRLLQAIQGSCVRKGVAIREGISVEGIAVQGTRVVGVRCGEELVRGDCVIVCAGAWSTLLGEPVARAVRVSPVRGQVVLLRFDERKFQRTVSCSRTYLVPRWDGHVVLGATEEPEAGFAIRNTASGVSGLIDRGLKLMPRLAEAEMVTMWANLRPGTPDDKPFIGPVPGINGLWAATGHYRSGLILAPATAEAVAALLLGRPYPIDLSPFSPGRALRSA